MERSMLFRGNLLKIGIIALAVLLTVGIGIFAAPSIIKQFWGNAPEGKTDKLLARAELVGPDTMQVPADVIATMGIQTAEVVTATQPGKMELYGTLGFDTSTLARIRPIFAGIVVDVGNTTVPQAEAGQTQVRPLDFGDHVEKGQLLAVILSKDLGTMKSQFLTAHSQLELDKITRDNLRKLLTQGSTALRSVLEAEQKVEGDIIALDAARRTLFSWGLTQEEVKALEEEAKQVRQGKSDPEKEKNWARYEVKSPISGTILERNVVLGETVNDNTLDLFKVGDLNRLRVWVNAYEEQLAILQSMSWPIKWQVRFPSDQGAPPEEGIIEGISSVIDPADHTAKVRGFVKNTASKLRAAQFVTAIVDVPPGAGEVQVPMAALVEDGRESIVFVEDKETKGRFTMRHAQVVRRTADVATIRARPGKTPPGRSPFEPLQSGERVVTSGSVELQAALDDLKTAGPTAQK
jgi:cobalt-zinc-cadmium efflux system membrane fusion protein